jgi:hypothetical protein|tara:strand:+ start:232 stop:459 length:228 start_codon:yes stop_codon:yes gene_type:complete
MEKKYVIIEKEHVESIEFKKILETSASTLRYSIDGNKTIVKFIGETPSFLDGETTYSHKEIIEIINDPNNGWIEN